MLRSVEGCKVYKIYFWKKTVNATPSHWFKSQNRQLRFLKREVNMAAKQPNQNHGTQSQRQPTRIFKKRSQQQQPYFLQQNPMRKPQLPNLSILYALNSLSCPL